MEKAITKATFKRRARKKKVVHRVFTTEIYQFKSVIDESLIQGDVEGFVARHSRCLHFIRLCN